MIQFQNNLAAITIVASKTYMPKLQKIKMFVNIGVKVGLLVTEVLFLLPPD